MRRMGRSKALTPVIGLSLAALVAGSLVMLAVLAQRLSLTGPGAVQLAPRRVHSGPAQPLVIAAEAGPNVQHRQRRTPAQRIRDEVAPIRIAQTPSPSPEPVTRRRVAQTDTRKDRAASEYELQDRSSKTAFSDSFGMRETSDHGRKDHDRSGGKALGHEKARGKGHAKHGDGD